MIALIPVRDGIVPLGTSDALAEAGGRALVCGTGARDGARALGVSCAFVELPPFAAGTWAATLAPLVAHERTIILPGSPDGRDLAPRLGSVLGRDVVPSAIAITDHAADVVVFGGRAIDRVHFDEPVVATIQPGVTGAVLGSDAAAVCTEITASVAHRIDAKSLSVGDPDPDAIDLAEAQSIFAGGAGLSNEEAFEILADVARACGASMGATRVITDRGWVPFRRQIGTTGVTVNPSIYVAFGISGAIQHTAGLGSPIHVISVNTDRSCPMMAMADVAIVADATATLHALAAKLGVDNG